MVARATEMWGYWGTVTGECQNLQPLLVGVTIWTHYVAACAMRLLKNRNGCAGATYVVPRDPIGKINRGYVNLA